MGLNLNIEGCNGGLGLDEGGFCIWWVCLVEIG